MLEMFLIEGRGPRYMTKVCLLLKSVEEGSHEAGTYLYKPIESEAGAVAAPTTNYESSSSHTGMSVL